MTAVRNSFRDDKTTLQNPIQSNPIQSNRMCACVRACAQSSALQTSILLRRQTTLLLGQLYYGVDEAVVRGRLRRHEVIAVQVLFFFFLISAEKGRWMTTKKGRDRKNKHGGRVVSRFDVGQIVQKKQLGQSCAGSHVYLFDLHERVGREVPPTHTQVFLCAILGTAQHGQ